MGPTTKKKTSKAGIKNYTEENSLKPKESMFFKII
jgi:hypothetical protein